MAEKHTYRGRTVAIGDTVQNTDITDPVGTAVTSMTWTEIENVGNIGDYGPDTNIVSYDTLGDTVTGKQKGTTDAGSPTIECARVDGGAGQDAMTAAGKADVYDNYVLKVTNQDGSIDYLRGIITGPVQKAGGVEDFDVVTYTIGLNQVPVHVAAV